MIRYDLDKLFVKKINSYLIVYLFGYTVGAIALYIIPCIAGGNPSPYFLSPIKIIDICMVVVMGNSLHQKAVKKLDYFSPSMTVKYIVLGMFVCAIVFFLFKLLGIDIRFFTGDLGSV